MQHDIIGAVLPAAPRPVWLRAVMVREGDDVVTRCCIVADGELFPVEVRVNVPELIRTAKALGLDRAHQDTVGGFGSFLKKAVKSVTHNKLVKSVAKVASKVVNNPVVQLANPIAAIAVHTTKKAVTGKGTIKGAAGKIIDAGSSVTTKLIPSPLSFISPKATAALGVGLQAVGVAKAGAVVQSVAKAAQGQVNLGKAAASAIQKQAVTAAQRAPLAAQVKKAVQIRQTVTKNAPALAKKIQDAEKVKASIATIAAKAKAGSAEAKQAANAIAKAVTTLDKIQSLNAAAAGGMAGLVITADGRIVRAPKGRFTLRASTAPAGQAQMLYRGPRDPVLRGLFTAISGAIPEEYDHDPSWGGHLDPGNELEGPLGAVRYSEGFELDDYSSLPGNWQVDATGDRNDTVGTRFGDPPERWSAYVDRKRLGVGDKVQFGVDRTTRTGTVEGVDDHGHLIVRSKRGNRHPEELLTVWREQVKKIRVGGSFVGASIAGALTP